MDDVKHPKIELERVNCNLCGSEDFKLLYRAADKRFPTSDVEFDLVQCRSCGLGFLNPRPTLESIQAFYSQAYYEEIEEGERRKRRPEKKAKYLEGLPPGRVLDIGCSGGATLKLLHDRGWEVYGMDYSDRAGNPYNLDIRYGELCDLQYPADYFDVVTAWAVFEHLHDPMKHFAEVRRILKPGGQLICLVPNLNSLASRYAYGEDIPRHLYFFSERTLHAYAGKNDLELTAIDFSNDIYSGHGVGVFRMRLLRWAGVPWREIMKRPDSLFLRTLSAIGVALGRFLVWPQVEIWLRRSGIIIATMRRLI